MKYKFASQIAQELASYAADEILKNRHFLPKNALLVPIPLYWQRKNWRGFNQAEEIGKIMSKKLGWDFNKNLLIRKTSTKPQVELRGKERKQNIRGVFKLNKPLDKIKPIILFDDVWTTGSTIKEAAKVLKRNRAKTVWALTITRSK
ncbi:MAG: hypothetical protein WBD86_01440 [Microgenomates group bacterium]